MYIFVVNSKLKGMFIHAVQKQRGLYHTFKNNHDTPQKYYVMYNKNFGIYKFSNKYLNQIFIPKFNSGQGLRILMWTIGSANPKLNIDISGNGFANPVLENLSVNFQLIHVNNGFS